MSLRVGVDAWLGLDSVDLRLGGQIHDHEVQRIFMHSEPGGALCKAVVQVVFFLERAERFKDQIRRIDRVGVTINGTMI